MVAKGVEGQIDQVKGRAPQALGKVTGKKSYGVEGTGQRAKGKLKEKPG